MKRIEFNCATGAIVEIDQIAYKDALGNITVLDFDQDATGLTVLSESELEAYRAPTPPSPLSQIRAIECTPAVADAMQRGTRLVAIAYAIDDLIRIAASKGLTVTRAQAHDWAMLNDSNYKTLYDAEQVIKPLRALV